MYGLLVVIVGRSAPKDTNESEQFVKSSRKEPVQALVICLLKQLRVSKNISRCREKYICAVWILEGLITSASIGKRCAG